MTRQPPIFPDNFRRVIVGSLPDGRLITQFQGSSWTVMDLRTTFAGYPQYALGERLKGLHDVLGWKPALLRMPQREA